MNGKLLFVGALMGATALASQAAQPIELGEPEVYQHRVNPRGGQAPTAGSTSATSPIIYHGGPIMAGTPNVYVIWYGNWNQSNGTDTAAGQELVRNFLAYIGGSPYFDINVTYSTAASDITGLVQYVKDTSDAYSQGSKLSDTKIATIVKSSINSGKLPADANGVYFVLTSSDVTVTSGFCTRYCGWHTHGNIAGLDIKYSFVGNAARCLRACAAQSVSPNNNPGVDAMISVIAHELEEAVTDPDLNAWYDGQGAENADKCAWTFGQNLEQQSNGSYANMTINGKKYLIQRNLLRTDAGDFCATGVDLLSGHIDQ